MKILLLSSSPRKEKSQTFLLAKEVLRGVASDVAAESEVIHLCNLKIEFCRACEACHKKIFSCPIKDDVNMVMKKMLEADVLVFASPNYINQVAASLKAIFDRASHFIHCKRLLGKYIFGVVTSGSGQGKAVLDYISYYAHTCGAQYAGGISSQPQLTKEKLEEAFKSGSKIALDIREKKVYPEQIEIIEKGKQYFKEIMKARKNEWKEEYLYWLDKGWL
ncbi:MAG: flavodoxin family protein [Candidatus Omnitrophica bacterium]|nr:flavodoxin family protein [Candidatus Omnitrophota bacterium]